MDISEIKQTEEFRRSEERFRLLAENAQDLIFRYRLKPTPGFEYVSPSSTAMIGYTPRSITPTPSWASRSCTQTTDTSSTRCCATRRPQSPFAGCARMVR